MEDREVEAILLKEAKRQNEGIELIASENYPSKEVREACGSIAIAKYAEGYPKRRYYGGCENIDDLETLCQERAKSLFHCAYANVQPHSGSQANFAAYRSLLNLGDKLYDFRFYDLGEDGRLDYGEIAKRLDEENPNLFLAGYSAYPYEIDFRKIATIIEEHNKRSQTHCYFMVDMAHIAGIIAAGLTQNPVEFADIVTSTTHKTLRGPRGGLILSNREDLAKKIDSAIFPYSQGGPLENVIAGKAIAFREAATPGFADYMRNVLANTKACNDELARLGAKVSGTENHLFLLNVLKSFGLNGKQAQVKLEGIGVTTNKNTIHGETLPPSLASGIRIGFAAATTRGCTIEQARQIGRIIFSCLCGKESEEALRGQVSAIAYSWKDVMEL